MTSDEIRQCENTLNQPVRNADTWITKDREKTVTHFDWK
jgi:hypothetical protein